MSFGLQGVVHTSAFKPPLLQCQQNELEHSLRVLEFSFQDFQ